MVRGGKDSFGKLECVEKFEIRALANGWGNGLVATGAIAASSLIFREPPLLSIHTAGRPSKADGGHEAQEAHMKAFCEFFIDRCDRSYNLALFWQLLEKSDWKPLEWMARHHMDVSTGMPTEDWENRKSSEGMPTVDRFLSSLEAHAPQRKSLSLKELSFAFGVMIRYHFFLAGFFSGTVRGVALYEMAGVINHCCCPNSYLVHSDKGAQVYALRDIQKGEQITIAYMGTMNRLGQTLAASHSAKQITQQLGRPCTCPVCLKSDVATVPLPTPIRLTNPLLIQFAGKSNSIVIDWQNGLGDRFALYDKTDETDEKGRRSLAERLYYDLTGLVRQSSIDGLFATAHNCGIPSLSAVIRSAGWKALRALEAEWLDGEMSVRRLLVELVVSLHPGVTDYQEVDVQARAQARDAIWSPMLMAAIDSEPHPPSLVSGSSSKTQTM